MIKNIKSLTCGFKALHQDEDGMEALQVVAIVAIAAIVLIFVKTTLWDRIKGFADSKTTELVGN